MNEILGQRLEVWAVTDNKIKVEFTEKGLILSEVDLSIEQPSIVRSFAKTYSVAQRLEQVCGADNYSLALRNSEHMANYIESGCWVSHQMKSKTGCLHKMFSKWFVGGLKSIQHSINILPDNLSNGAAAVELKNKVENPELVMVPPETPSEAIFPEMNDYVQVSRAPVNNPRNILFVGAPGSGKSTIVNHLFNCKVSTATSSPLTVNVQVSVLPGTYKGEQINLIDTAGLCDTPVTSENVRSLLQNFSQKGINEIHKVVVVCSGGIQRNHWEELHKIFSWLKYEDHSRHFVFLYNKCEHLTETVRERSLVNMCKMLKVENNNNNVRAVAFNRRAAYHNIEQHLNFLKRALLEDRSSGHIKVDRTKCLIL